MKTLKILTILSLAIVGFGLGACETVKGAGQDVHNAGEEMDEAL
ncbi:MAG: hypothetical protein ACLFR0_08315 [Alphaproteobacteria bacterium]